MTLEIEPQESLEGPIDTTGTIIDVQKRTVTIDGDEAVYLDFSVQIDHPELKQIVGGSMKVGYPANLSPDTLLGKFVKRMGQDPTQTVNFETFKGVAVSIVCDKHDGRDGKRYWRIDRDLVRKA